MYLQSFHLDDFGCFTRATLSSLDDGIIVIGGPQRAGKTTFTQATRQLGYGISRSGSLPPETDRYALSAELDHDGDRVFLNLDRHADPTVSPVNGETPVALDDIFGAVSRQQYHQLFTISLRQLKADPEGTDSEDLSEILLGAAYGDLSDIPEIEEQFHDRAYEIGRSTGNPHKNGELRPPLDIVEEGIEAKEAATEQVDTYRKKKSEYDDLTDELDGLREEIATLETKRERLSVIEAEFSDLRALRQALRDLNDTDVEAAESFPTERKPDAERLLDQYHAALDTIDTEEREFEAATDVPEIDAHHETLLNTAEAIEDFTAEISRWRSDVEDVREKETEQTNRRELLQNDVADLHPNWDGEFAQVQGVVTDHLSRDQIQTAANTYSDVDARLDGKRIKADAKRKKIEKIGTDISEMDNGESGDQAKSLVQWTASVAGVAVLVAGGGSIVGSPIAGIVAGLVVLVLGSIYVYSKVEIDGGSSDPVREAKGQKQSLETQLEGLESAIRTLEADREAAVAEFREIRDTLGLPSDVSPDGIVSFYDKVTTLNENIHDLEQDESALADRRSTLEAELHSTATTMHSCAEFEWDDEDQLDRAEALFSAIETATDELEHAQDLESAYRVRVDLEAKIQDVLNTTEAVETITPDETDETVVTDRLDAFIDKATEAEGTLEQKSRSEALQETLLARFDNDAVRESFEPLRHDDDADWLETFERAAKDYVDQESVQRVINSLKDDLETLKSQKQALEEDRIDLESTLEALKSDQDIIAAREKIHEGRKDLRRLGEEYAVNRMAELITKRLHEHFIEEVTGELLDEASAIFERVTGEYAGIDQTGDLEDLDFEALRPGADDHGTQQLSRATAEQLFMAVRIARIRQLEPTLPVVIDDAMTNFDPAHAVRMLRTLEELAETNQVFLLTCHPELVELASNAVDVSQYWCLDDGQFEGPHDEPDAVQELLLTEKAVPSQTD